MREPSRKIIVIPSAEGERRWPEGVSAEELSAARKRLAQKACERADIEVVYAQDSDSARGEER